MGLLAIVCSSTCLAQQDAKPEQDDDKWKAETFQFYVGTAEGNNTAQYSIDVYLKPRNPADLKDAGLQEKDGQGIAQIVVLLPVFGLRLEPLPGTIKSQLKTLNDRGMLVTGFHDDPGLGAMANWQSPQVPRGVSNVQLGSGLIAFSAHDVKPLDATMTKHILESKFHVHDILLSVDGKPVVSEEQLLSHLLQAGRKKEVALEVVRDGRTGTLKFRTEELILPSRLDRLFAPLSQSEDEYKIGIQMSEVDEITRKLLKTLPEKQGVVVDSVAKGSAAEAAQLKKYDIILALDGKPVGNAQALVKLLQAAGGKKIQLLLLREGQNSTIELTPQSIKQFDVTKVDVTKQGWSYPGMPWTIKTGNGPVFEPIRFPLRVLDADSNDYFLMGQNAPDSNTSPETQIQAEIRDIREAIGSLTRAIEKLETKLDKKEAQPPQETDKPGPAEQKKAIEQPETEAPAKN
jgi:hypothetical protein